MRFIITFLNIYSENSTSQSSNLDNKFIKSLNEYEIKNKHKDKQAEIIFIKDIKDFYTKTKLEQTTDGGIKDRMRKYDTMKWKSILTLKFILEKKEKTSPLSPLSPFEGTGRSNFDLTNNNYINTNNEVEPEEQVKTSQFKQTSQSVNTEKGKKGPKDLKLKDKERPFKRPEPNLGTSLKSNNTANTNTSKMIPLKIEREVEVNIIESKSGKKHNKLNIVQTVVNNTVATEMKSSIRESGNLPNKMPFRSRQRATLQPRPESHDSTRQFHS